MGVALNGLICGVLSHATSVRQHQHETDTFGLTDLSTGVPKYAYGLAGRFQMQALRRYLCAGSGTVDRLFWSVTANGDLARATSMLVRQDVDQLGVGDGSVPFPLVLPVAPTLQATAADTSNLSLKALASAVVGHLPAGDVRLGGNVSVLRTSLSSRSADGQGSATVSSYRTSVQANLKRRSTTAT